MRNNTNALFLCLALATAVIYGIVVAKSTEAIPATETSLAKHTSSEILSLDTITNEHSRAARGHDHGSLLSYMWHKGKPISPLDDNFTVSDVRRTTLVFDALSIGSQFNVPRMEAQSQSWASTPFVRYLFGATEKDDADPECHLKLNSSFECFSKCSQVTYNSDALKGLGLAFSHREWIGEHQKTSGWVCAQQRFAHAVGKMGRFYRREGPQSLPDFLLIQDDDTWIGMNQIVSYLMTKNHTRPFVTPVCTIVLPINVVNHTFPWGGFGFILNREALDRLFRPNYCDGTTTATTDHALEHEKVVCSKLNENGVGENVAFREGFSVSDVMDHHASLFPYRQCNHWPNPGYCMFGDWILGYYVNQYEIGSRELPGILNNVHMGIELGISNGLKGACGNVRIAKCRRSRYQYSCHEMKPWDMFKMTVIDSKKPIDRIVENVLTGWTPPLRNMSAVNNSKPWQG